ncbi:MAG: sigma-70 family RNA polymerase sigma factor [Rhodothermales bacterium]
MPAPHEVTQLLVALGHGDQAVMDRLMPLVYDELRGLARQYLRHERSGHTLNTTALVHEAYFKLVDQDRVTWQNRAHFFAIATQAIRRILVDNARARRRMKRGGGAAAVTLDEVSLMPAQRADELIALDEALTRLATLNERLSRVVEYRYFTGLTIEETAEVMNVSTMTVKRDWRKAKAWLARELLGGA